MHLLGGLVPAASYAMKDKCIFYVDAVGGDDARCAIVIVDHTGSRFVITRSLLKGNNRLLMWCFGTRLGKGKVGQVGEHRKTYEPVR